MEGRGDPGTEDPPALLHAQQKYRGETWTPPAHPPGNGWPEKGYALLLQNLGIPPFMDG